MVAKRIRTRLALQIYIMMKHAVKLD